MNKKNIIFAGAVILIVIVIIVGFYTYDLNNDVNHTVDRIYEPLERGESSIKRDVPIQITDSPDPISILLLGVDQRPGDQGRSDTIMVMTLNPKKESMYLFNIPRDTRTTIIGKGFEDKINHAYAFGGANMSIETIEEFLDIPIDYYIQVNLDGFISIIDILGGINVNVNQEFNYEGYSFRSGETQMDGETTLAYSRMRYQDPNGDLGRNKRQQQIITALIDKGKSIQTLFKVDDILEEIAIHSKTNLTREDIDQLRNKYVDATKNKKSLHIEGKNQRINEIFYYIVDEKERQRVSELLKKHLELEKSGDSQ